jgi:large subunit ribosomal protein L15
MKLSQIKPAVGSTKRPKIVGRGPGSGHGKTSTRGHKGQKSRTGGGVRPGFIGGQTPIHQTVPRRGFNHAAEHRFFDVVNIERLAGFEAGSVITPVELKAKGLIKGNEKVKILGKGDLKAGITVKAHAFSASAVEKIKAAGGTAEVL